jgi:hypothetical protein
MAKAKKVPSKKMPPQFMKKGAAKSETSCPDCNKPMKGKKCSCGYEAK